MPTVLLRVPKAAPYPYQPLRAGLEAVGCRVVNDVDADMLVVWSPWVGSKRHGLQQAFARRARPVIVIENGWLSPIRGVPYWQIAFDDWNAGEGFPGPDFGDGGRGRWMQWRVDLAPWRAAGDHILVVGQRGHPTDDRSMPPGWLDVVRLHTDRPVLLRRRGDAPALGATLRGAHVAVVWTSNAAAHAIIAGIPVFYAGPRIMCRRLAAPLAGADLEAPLMLYRPPELEYLAYAQWNADEIATGRPFKRLLDWRST